MHTVMYPDVESFWNYKIWCKTANDYMGKCESKVASSWQYSLAPFEPETLKTPPVPRLENLEAQALVIGTCKGLQFTMSWTFFLNDMVDLMD